jgi:hypothetical protein
VGIAVDEHDGPAEAERLLLEGIEQVTEGRVVFSG